MVPFLFLWKRNYNLLCREAVSRNQEHFPSFIPCVETGILFLHANKGRKRETVFDAFEISCTLRVEQLGPV